MPFKKGNKTVWSKESIEKRRVTVLKRYPAGLKPSEETRKKQSKAHLGLKPSKETIEKRKMTIAKRYPDGLKPSRESREKGIRTKAKKPKKICSVAGCKKLHYVRGYCQAHYSYERKKHGFGVPVGEWIKGPLKDWAQDLLDTSRLKRQGLINSKLYNKIWQQHLIGEKDATSKLWALLMFQSWFDSTK